ncbi:hypothetical protein JOB18_016514 [Solea senegalensis]|uniref:Uncharacterized protein n=1 Tax=Solea senegalensis TaxID=28829 RepID=A0AAV6SCF6_SOLSE|nr:hypothetical protein JOB18_016514 [Solea senegalensis]
MCEFLTRVEIRGKRGRMVPVLLKPAMVTAMELLAEVRESCGVPSENLFVFARPEALSAYRGGECLQKYAKLCGLEPLQLARMSKVLLAMERGTVSKFKGMTLDDIEIDPEEKMPDSNEEEASSDPSDKDEDEFTSTDMDTSTSSGPPPAATPPTQEPAERWEGEEIKAVEKHLMNFIRTFTVPGAMVNELRQDWLAEYKADLLTTGETRLANFTAWSRKHTPHTIDDFKPELLKRYANPLNAGDNPVDEGHTE